ncbi:hypothetical protein KI387_035633, partial [Taxus chinensis]
MSRILVFKSRKNDGDFSQRSQHPSHGEGGPQDKKKSCCDREQQEESQSMVERRILRCQYRSLKSSIAGNAQEDTFWFIWLLEHIDDMLMFAKEVVTVLLCNAEEKEEIINAESDKFDSVFNKVQNLHNLVHRPPREQVTDAEALLDITSALLASVKSTQNSNVVSLPDFISALVRNYSGKAHGNMSFHGNDNQTHISWETLGLEASMIFSHAAGVST